MLLKDYLEVYKFKPEPLNIKEITDVRVQAFRHYYRDDSNDLGDAQRPSESKKFKEWRKANKRAVNHEILDTAISESTAIINSNKPVLSEQSSNLEAWLIEERFYYLDSSLSFWDYFIRCIYPKSCLDPNGKIIVFPYNKQNKNIPPNLINPTEKAGIDIRFVRSDKILKFESPEIFGFEAGLKKYKIDGNVQELAYYYIADYFNWYILEPISYKEDVLQYSQTIWYNHNTNDTPVVSAIGILTENIKGHVYQESVFRTAFPYLDEFVNSFGDNQVIRTKAAHPTLVMPRIDCAVCKGQKFVFDDTKMGVD